MAVAQRRIQRVNPFNLSRYEGGSGGERAHIQPAIAFWGTVGHVSDGCAPDPQEELDALLGHEKQQRVFDFSMVVGEFSDPLLFLIALEEGEREG
ncbi:MAG: hypothetical protein RI935_285 [Candidatus Parcubacteria bacterium]|jgi:hypothetical protein